MIFNIYLKTSTSRKKTKNQDFASYSKNSFNDLLFVIADGVGQYKDSNLASEKATLILKKEFQNENFSLLKEEQIYLWSENVIKKKIFDSLRKIKVKIATTFTFMIICQNKFYLFHIGNTRAYFYSQTKNKLLQLTVDQNFLVDRNSDSFSWLKGKKFLENSLSNYSLCYIDKWSGKIFEGYLFFTTDGLHDFVSNKKISEIISDSNLEEKRKIEILYEQALFNGSLDDITCLLVKIK